MFAALTKFISPFSSSSSSLSFLSHAPTPSTTVQFAPFGTFQSHECISLVKFSKTSRIELKRMICEVGFRQTDKFLIQSNSMGLPSNLGTEAGTLFSCFQEMGFDIKETEFLLNKNPALRLESLDSIRDRILSLQSVGIHGYALHCLVAKCPNVLTEGEIDAFIRFVRDDLNGKIETARLERLLASTEPRFLVGFDRKVRLLLDRGVPQEKIGHVLNNVNLAKALCFKPIEVIERTVTFLDPFGGIDIIVRRPAILNYDLDNQLIPRVEFLKELSGGDEVSTGTVLRKLPAILTYSAEHTERHVELLRSLAGLSDQEIFKIFFVFPNVISASRERKLRPRIGFLKECGLDSNDIFKFLIKAPLFLGLSFEENLAYKLGFLVKIGYEYRTRELAVAMGAVTRTSCENLQKVVDLFLSYGLSFADILAMSKKHPQILQYNPSSLEEKMEYLIEEMGREVCELLAFPAFLGYKLDDRIKHRYEVKKKTIGEGMSLNKLLTVSTERFSKKKKNKTITQLK